MNRVSYFFLQYITSRKDWALNISFYKKNPPINFEAVTNITYNISFFSKNRINFQKISHIFRLQSQRMLARFPGLDIAFYSNN